MPFARRRARPHRSALASMSALLALLVATTGAGATTSTKIDIQLPAGYSIGGTIRDSAGAVLPNAGVIITIDGVDRWDASDSAGKYQIVGLSAGSYVVQVVAPPDRNLVDGYYTSANSAHYTGSKGSATMVKVGPSKTTIDVKLPAGHTITGTITNSAGVPLEGAIVYANGTTSDFTDTDSTGKYTLRGLSGSVTVSVQPPGRSVSQRGFYTSAGTSHFTAVGTSATKLSMSANKTGISVRLPNGYSISGTVTSSTGTPIAGALIEALSSTFETEVVDTDAQGRYTLRGLSTGSYRLNVRFSDNRMNIDPADVPYMDGYYTTSNANRFTSQLAGATAVTVGPSLTGINLKVATGFSITGTIITTTGASVEGATVRAIGPYIRGVTTDASGKYVIRGLSSASWKMQIEAPDGLLMSGWYTSANANRFTSAAASATASTTGPSIIGRTIKVPNGSTVYGRITVAGGAPASGAWVHILKADYERAAYTASDGSYALNGLGSGSYTIELRSPGGSGFQWGYYHASATGHFTATRASASSVVVGP